MNDWPENLKRERKRIGLTQAEADALLELGKGQCAAWESERNDPLAVTKKGVLDTLRAIKTPRSRRASNTKT